MAERRKERWRYHLRSPVNGERHVDSPFNPVPRGSVPGGPDFFIVNIPRGSSYPVNIPWENITHVEDLGEFEDAAAPSLAEPCLDPNPWDGYAMPHQSPVPAAPCGRPKGHSSSGGTWGKGHSEKPLDDDEPTKAVVRSERWVVTDADG